MSSEIAMRPDDPAIVDVARPLVEEVSELRVKNQVTLPRLIVRALGVEPGDRLVFEIHESAPHEVRVRPLRRDYAGALAGIYGTPEETAEYLRQERESWGE